MTNISSIFNTNVKINPNDTANPLSDLAIWPNAIEVCITRIPIRKRDGYSPDTINQIAKKLKANMVKNGVVFLICYAPVECKSRPFEVAKIMTDNGFHHVDNIIIQKSWLPGKRSEVNLVNSHEYVLHFCNGSVWNLDRLPIKEYLEVTDELSCPGNTWKVETGSLEEAYPLDLAELLIRMTDALPGSIVFDPFMGTQSGLKAALTLGHSFYGFEPNPRKIKRYQKTIKDHMNGEL